MLWMGFDRLHYIMGSGKCVVVALRCVLFNGVTYNAILGSVCCLL